MAAHGTCRGLKSPTTSARCSRRSPHVDAPTASDSTRSATLPMPPILRRLEGRGGRRGIGLRRLGMGLGCACVGWRGRGGLSRLGVGGGGR
eukprot:scaffold34587_cov90-Isochrysis_galbana.AAC.1